MAKKSTVTVTFEVDAEHEIQDRITELKGELENVQENSEVGLVFKSFKILTK